jgi:hypothetical protein
MHRIFAVLQFGILASMASFTNHFNIFFGLIPDNQSGLPASPVNFQVGTNFNSSSGFAWKTRAGKLPVINAKGISFVMGASRLLLFVQYLLGESVRYL